MKNSFFSAPPSYLCEEIKEKYTHMRERKKVWNTFLFVHAPG
jgi:hypothetical protein